MKKITISMVVGAVLLTSNQAVAQDASLPLVDVSTHALFYSLGGGSAVPSPGSSYVTHRVTARFQGGLSYSCGKFDFHNNISQMVNQIKSQVRQIPQQLQGAVSAAVASLPGYLMQKINPNLYNTITRTLDETTELFRLSYKSCEAIERDTRQNPKENPYAGFFSASIANKWSIGQKANKNIADIDDEVKKDPSGPVKWIGGEDYGTPQKPIQINHDLVVAGYNIMLGRSGDVSIDTKPTGKLLLQPIVKVWKKPSDAGKWLQSVVGEKQIVTVSRSPKETSVTGDGLRPIVTALVPQIQAALNDALNKNDFTLLNEFASLSVSNGLISGLREMPLGERSVFTERLVSEMSVNEAAERVALIRQMLLVGLNAPDIVASQAGGTTTGFVRGSTLPDLDVQVDEIVKRNELKQKSVNSTALAIIGQTEARRRAGLTSDPGTITSSPIIIDGATKIPTAKP